MAESRFVYAVTQSTYPQLVLENSRQVPVLVDFWADWCGPCKMLMPVLSKLADEYGGKFFLAKVNTDTEQALATQYGVKSLPTVKLFKDGKPVDEFMGAQAETAVRALLDRHLPRASDALVHNALLAARAGKIAEALAILQQAAQSDPDNDRVKLELARVLAFLGRTDEAESTLQSLSIDSLNNPDANAIRAELEFAAIIKTARPPDELLKAVQANPKDSAARYELAAHLVIRRQYPEALEQLLELVRIDRKYGDDAARKAMVSVFNLLGGSGNLVTEYRRKLSMALN